MAKPPVIALLLSIMLSMAGLIIPVVTATAANASACIVARDASAPAAVHSATGVVSASTASFTPPANSLVEVRVNTLQKAAGGVSASVTDSAGGTYTSGPGLEGSTAPDGVWFFERYLNTAPGAITVTATQTGTNKGSIQLKVFVLTGAASDQSSAATATFQGSGTAQNHAITTTKAGSLVFTSAANNSGSAVMTALSTTANNDRWGDTADARTGAMGQSTGTTVTPGSVTLGWTSSVSKPFAWAAQEVIPSNCAVDLLASKHMIYNTEIGAWENPSDPPFANSTVINAAKAAKPEAIRFAAYDCFTDQTCGRDNHAGVITRANFDSQVSKITGSAGYGSYLWFKLLPIAKGAINSEPDGSQFCPPVTNLGMNLSLFKSQLDEIKAAGYTGPIVLESSNEAEFDCWQSWGFTGAGAVGVSKTIGDMYAATMPALVKYARSLGFAQVISDGYLGVSGGPGWGQACTQDGTGQWGWSCAYQARWVDEFATEVLNSYTANGNDPDYLPQVLSIHAYPHSTDFTSTAGYDFPDGEAYQYYRNWLVKSRAELERLWGATLGDTPRFAISEWNAGVSRGGTGDWVGWTTTGKPGAFYDGWYNMLQGDGNTQGAGTRYWEATLFEVASNSDTGTGKWYNIIHQDGTVPAWYSNYQTASLNDPLP